MCIKLYKSKPHDQAVKNVLFALAEIFGIVVYIHRGILQTSSKVFMRDIMYGEGNSKLIFFDCSTVRL